MNPPRRLHPIRRLLRFAATLFALAAAILLLGRQILFQGPYRTPTPLPVAGLIDLHCHAAGIGAGGSGCFVSTAMRHNPRFGIYLKAFGVDQPSLEREGDTLLLRRLSESVAKSRHLAAVVVLALDGVVDPDGRLDTNRTEVYIPNTFVAGAATSHTNLLFGASVNPHRLDALEQLEWCANHGAVLVKWIPSIMEIDPADPRLLPFYRRLKQLPLPLLTHPGPEKSFTFSRDELADPERLRQPLLEGVTVIAAHAGLKGESMGERDFDRLRRLMHEFPNLYADLSSLTQINKPGALREALADSVCRARLLYGSDFPLINTALVSPWYFPLNLTEAQRSEIVKLENPWDRDIALKQALGVPAEVFSRTAEIIRRPLR